MEDSLQHCISLWPKDPHSAIITGATGCGKTKFILDLLEEVYLNVFKNIIILCPTIKWNETYKMRSWVWKNDNVYVVNPGEKLHDWLRLLFKEFQGESTLYIIDDCAAKQAMVKKRDMLTELAYSGRHAKQSVWILTQRYNSVLKDFRTQTRWVALFHCKDRDSFEECLRENDIVPLEELAVLRRQLAKTKHSKLILKTDQPAEYKVL